MACILTVLVMTDEMTLERKLNDLQLALDALIVLDGDRYRRTINNLRDDIATIQGFQEQD